jgi:hypothetical protein
LVDWSLRQKEMSFLKARISMTRCRIETVIVTTRRTEFVSTNMRRTYKKKKEIIIYLASDTSLSGEIVTTELVSANCAEPM